MNYHNDLVIRKGLTQLFLYLPYCCAAPRRIKTPNLDSEWYSVQQGVFTCLESLEAQKGEKVIGSHPVCNATFLLSNYTD